MTLDVTGMVCPGPVVEARKIFQGLQRGQVMKLISTCGAAREEVDAWCAATGNRLLDSQQTGPGAWAFYIRKG